MASKISKCSSKSKYIDSLDHQHRERYMQKIKDVCGIDPYQVDPKKLSANEEQLPDINFGDIIMYLVNGTSAYTLEQFKAYKSLEAYNYVVSGWVDSVNTYKPDGCVNIIVTAKVSHSQRLNAKPLQPWIIASPQGTVLSAHCTCMAGLGESCSHVAALLFYIEEMQKYRERVSVTGKLAYWKKPSKNSVEYKELSNIDFRSATKLKQVIDNPVADDTQSTPYRILNLSTVPVAGISDMKQILQRLEEKNKKPAIMTLIEPFCEKFKPLPQNEHLPSSLLSLRNENTDSMSLEQLLDHCSKISISITKEQVVAVEKETQLQNKCKLCHNVREGRITSTTLHSVCHTNSEAPSISLLKSLTSASVSVKTYQMIWGVKMEDLAKRQYTEKMKETHDLFSILPCGFCLHPEIPFMGSSPDGMVSCVCCGKGCIEIKCPYSAKDMNIQDALSIKNFCLVNEDDNVMLCRTHPYYTQVQCHIHMSGSEYCDFIVWTTSDIFIERIEPNTAFWNNVLAKATQFWQAALLLELVAKYFTRRDGPIQITYLESSQAKSLANSQSDEKELWCFCRKPESGRMIACDNKGCLNQWFHFECIGLKRAPQGLLYCLECTQTKQSQTNGMASKSNKN